MSGSKSVYLIMVPIDRCSGFYLGWGGVLSYLGMAAQVDTDCDLLILNRNVSNGGRNGNVDNTQHAINYIVTDVQTPLM